MASRASSRTSFSIRMSRSRRPTIGDPSNFRRVPVSDRRREDFRPLELSIYLPGNRLSPLPIFGETFEDRVIDLEYPPNALLRARSDSLLYRPSTSFKIPRKPVASSAEISTTSGSRHSVDARLARSSTSIHSRSQSLRRGSGGLDSESTKEFLAALDTRLPPSPSPIRARSSTEPGSTIHRKASQQSMRLRIHLEERQEIERRLKDIDTIVEEKAMGSDHTDRRLWVETQQVKSRHANTPLSRARCARSSTLSDFRTPLERPLPPTPLTFNQPNPTKHPPPPPPPPKRALLKHEAAPDIFPQHKSSARARVSQWLFRWTSEETKEDARQINPSEGPFYQCSVRSGISRAATQSTVSSTSNTLDGSLMATVTSTSSLERHALTLPRYQACLPYQEYDSEAEKRSNRVPGGLEVGVAV